MLRLAFNNVNCYVEGDGSSEDNAMIANISHCLSYLPKGSRFIKNQDYRFKTFSMLYEGKDYTMFPTGLVDYVLNVKHKRKARLEDGTLGDKFEYYEVKIGELIDRRSPKPIPQMNPINLWNPKEKKPIELFDYQEEAIKIFLLKERGIIRVSMGGGKTMIAMALTQILGLKTLFVVGAKDLVRQTIRSYKDNAGIEAGKIGDGSWDLRDVTVSTIQTLSRKINEKETQQFLLSREFVIWDETQHASDTYQNVSRKLKRAYYRVGFSATVGMGEKEERLKSMALSGPLIYDVKMKRLVDNKQLARPTIIFLRIPRMAGDPRWDLMDFSEQYEKGIVYNEFRNTILAYAIYEMRKRGYGSLTLIEKLDQGYAITGILKQYMKQWNAKYISGKDSADIRDQAVIDLERGDLDILVTSRIFNEGRDIPMLESVVVAAGYRAAGLTFQRYGRGARKTPVKDDFTVIDCYDEFAPKLKEHSDDRLAVVKKNKAFDVLLIEWEDLPKTLDMLFRERQSKK